MSQITSNSPFTHVAQVQFSIEEVTLGYFNALPTALSGEQFAINQKSVDDLYNEFMKDGTLLQQPMEITKFGDIILNTGGRHRGAALGMTYESDVLVKVLCFVASTAQEVADRIISSNGSRRCTKGEQKLLRTAATHEFGTVNKASIMGLLYNVDGTASGALSVKGTLDKVVTLVALELVSKVDNGLKVDVSEKLATSIVAQIKKMKRRVEYTTTIEPSFDKAGQPKGGGTVSTFSPVSIIDEVLGNSAKMDALLDAVVAVAKCAPRKGVLVTVAIHDTAKASKEGASCILSSEVTVSDSNVTYYNTVFNFADNISRGAATYAALSALAIKEELVFSLEVLDSEALEVNTDDEYGDIDGLG